MAQRKKLITVLKILFSAVLLYFIFTKIAFKDVWDTLKTTRPLYLGAALVFFVLSKVIAAFRLNLYLHGLRVFLTHKSNLQLYLLGMFYNLFLPGGIGGDAYKGYLLKKKFDVDTKKVVSVLVLDRLSGLLLLFVYACLLALAIQNDVLNPFKLLFGSGMVLGVLVFWLLNKKFFAYVLGVFWQSLGYSAMVQLAQLVSVFFILRALQIETHMLVYLFVFLISSIVSVVPVTLGGIGSRELTFYYGALWLGLDQNTSISVSVVFFLITAVVSLTGLFYHFKKVELDTTKTQ